MLKLPDNLIRVAESRAPEVLLAPGGYFFSRLVPVPAEVTRDEFASLAELTLEESSPFPMEQLAWGFLVDEARRELWLYAACRPRIGASVMDSWDDAEHVFPAFLPLLLAFKQPPTRLLWQSAEEILLLDFADGARFPTRIRHRRLPELDEEDEASAAAIIDSVDGFLREQGIDREATPIYELKETIVGDDRQVSFLVGQQGSEPEAPVTLADAEASWWADIRSAEFIEAEQRSRRWQNTLWSSLQWASWAAVALVLLVLLNIVGNMLVKRRAELIVAQEPAVVAIEQNSAFLNDLRKFSQRPLRPFEVLGLTNEYRPFKNIYYEVAEVDTTDGVTIRGVTSNVNEANAFNDSLIASTYFKNREKPSSRKKSNGETTFTFIMDYVGPTEDVVEPLAANEMQEGEE